MLLFISLLLCFANNPFFLRGCRDKVPRALWTCNLNKQWLHQSARASFFLAGTNIRSSLIKRSCEYAQRRADCFNYMKIVLPGFLSCGLPAKNTKKNLNARIGWMETLRECRDTCWPAQWFCMHSNCNCTCFPLFWKNNVSLYDTDVMAT